MSRTFNESKKELTHFFEKNPEIFEIMDEFGLTIDETKYILAYTGYVSAWANQGTQYLDLNDKNNTDPEITEVKDFIKNLDQVLNKLPSFNNEKLYRFNPSQIQINGKFEINEIIKVECYLSTTKEDWEQEIYWEITTAPNNSKAKDISRVSWNQKENEVLFSRNVRLRIDNISNNCTYMTEITG